MPPSVGSPAIWYDLIPSECAMLSWFYALAMARRQWQLSDARAESGHSAPGQLRPLRFPPNASFRSAIALPKLDVCRPRLSLQSQGRGRFSSQVGVLPYHSQVGGLQTLLSSWWVVRGGAWYGAWPGQPIDYESQGSAPRGHANARPFVPCNRARLLFVRDCRCRPKPAREHGAYTVGGRQSRRPRW